MKRLEIIHLRSSGESIESLSNQIGERVSNSSVPFGLRVLQFLFVCLTFVVTKAHPIPDNSVVCGNPAAIVKQRDPEKLAAFMKNMDRWRKVHRGEV